MVPEKYNLEEFAEETKDFTSEIIAITKKKPMHYSLTFGSLNNFSKLEFKIHSSCILNIDMKQCSRYSSPDNDKGCRIKHFIYSKEDYSEQIELKIGE